MKFGLQHPSKDLEPQLFDNYLGLQDIAFGLNLGAYL